jgi:D-alanyl-D-alanine carboxypeptidase-like protein
MAKPAKSPAAKSFMADVAIKSILPINVGLTPAQEATMVSILGSPTIPLTTSCQNSKASTKVKDLMETRAISPIFKLTGIRPALDSVQTVLKKVFAANPDLEGVLGTEGMLCVRRRKPTSGAVSKKLSNHSWGTAVDFNIVGFDAPGNTKQNVPRFISIMIPFFNAAGWLSGIAFNDSMHFEVADETIKKWSKDGEACLSAG